MIPRSAFSKQTHKTQFDVVWAKVKALTGWKHQKQLADFLGIAQPNVTEAKRRGVFRPGWLQHIAEVYEVSVESLAPADEGGGTAWIEQAATCVPAETRNARLVQLVVGEIERAQTRVGVILPPDTKARLAGFLYEWPVCGTSEMLDPDYVDELTRLLAGGKELDPVQAG